jgi:hypothetical protein
MSPPQSSLEQHSPQYPGVPGQHCSVAPQIDWHVPSMHASQSPAHSSLSQHPLAGMQTATSPVTQQRSTPAAQQTSFPGDSQIKPVAAGQQSVPMLKQTPEQQPSIEQQS